MRFRLCPRAHDDRTTGSRAAILVVLVAQLVGQPVEARQESGETSGLEQLLERIEGLLRTGAAEEASPLVETVVVEARGAADRLEAARALNESGLRLLQAGRTAGSEPLLRTAFEIRSQDAPESLAVAESLVGLGALALARGDFGTAREHLERSLALRQSAGGTSLEIAESLHQLGRVAYAEGDLSEATRLWTEVKATREELAPDSAELAATLHNLGLALEDRGDLDGARELHETALAIRRRIEPRSADVASSLNALGNVALTEGRLDLARERYEAALSIEEVARPGTRHEARPLNNLGLVAFNQGDHQAALEYYERTLELEQRASPDSMGVARTLLNIAWIARDRGDRLAAREYLARALAIQERQAPVSLDVARTLVALGTVAHDALELDQARELYLRALEIQQERAPDSLAVAMTLDNLGAVERLLGDLETAERRHRRALAVFERLAPGSIELTFCLYALAEVALDRGELEQAKRHLDRAIEIRRRWAPDSLVVAQSLALLGKVLIEANELEAAELAYNEAWEIVGLHGQRVSGDEAVRAYADVYRPFATTLMELQLERGDALAALRTVEESRAQSLLQLMALRDGRSALVDPASRRALEAAEGELRIARSRIEETAAHWAQAAGATARGAGQETGREAASAERQEAMAAYTLARKEMERRLADVRRSVSGSGEEPLGLDEARRALPADSIFVAFFVGEERVRAFAVSADPAAPVDAYVVGLSRSELQARIEHLREILWRDRLVRGVGGLSPARRGRDDAALEVASRDLFRRLFPEPVRPLLAAARRWILSPDEALWELPFAALDAGAGEETQWVGLEKALTYTPSLTVFARERQRREPASGGTPPPLVVGDPRIAELPDAPGGSWETLLGPPDAARSADGAALGRWPLPGSRDEARRVGELYDVEPLLGASPTEAEVRRRLTEAPLVHLSSHAFFHPERALSSGVLLASEERAAAVSSESDGVLQAWELGGPLLLRAELVVLSACETGLGETTRGEGVLGLTRALQAAGARSVVATHWRIDDRGTADLMVAFHRALGEGLAKDEALRRAMVGAAGTAATSHPFYWAGFFLTGDPAPLPPALRGE